MSGIENESSATSEVLFLNVKGEQMRFFIRPGPTKVQLQPLIMNGGGVVCRTQEPKAILLAEPGDITAAANIASHFYISTQYVLDCVAQNQQLDIERYRFNYLQPVQTRRSSQKRQGTGRLGYSLEDDAAILKIIAKHRKEAKGNQIWKKMERQKVTNHSWQSMKDRFLKHLQHKLEQKTPENEKVSPLTESSSSEDNISLSKTTIKKKAAIVSSSDSDAPQTTLEHERGAPEQTVLQPTPKKTISPQGPSLKKMQTDENEDEVRKETDTDKTEHQHDIEQPEVTAKRARMDPDLLVEDMESLRDDTNALVEDMGSLVEDMDAPVEDTPSGKVVL